MLHGCTIGNRVLVGMGSILLDGVVVGDDVMIGAGSLVPQNKQLESGFQMCIRDSVRDRRADPLIHPRPADTGASVEPVSALLRIIHMTTGQINSLSLAALRANRL